MKKVWVYLVIVLIIIFTILGMIYLSNNVNLSFKKDELVNNIINEEATKIKEDYPWVYTYPSDKINILIPYFNIQNKLLKGINDENINEDLSDIIQTNYLYSINSDLLSLIYIKEHSNNTEYKVYNFNLKSSKLLDSHDVLNYLNEDYTSVLSKVLLSIELYLKKYNYEEDYYLSSLQRTKDNIQENGIDIYVGSNKELYVVVKIYHNQVETVLFDIGG